MGANTSMESRFDGAGSYRRLDAGAGARRGHVGQLFNALHGFRRSISRCPRSGWGSLPMQLSLSWIPTAFLLAAAMFAVPFGRIADIYGMKRIFSYGVILFTVSSLLCAVSPSARSLILFRVFQGIAAG